MVHRPDGRTWCYGCIVQPTPETCSVDFMGSTPPGARSPDPEHEYFPDLDPITDLPIEERKQVENLRKALLTEMQAKMIPVH